MNLFSNGIEAMGYTPIEQWRSILDRARRQGQFVGVNEQTYPGDLASFTRHYTELKKLNQRYPLPEPLTLDQFNSFLTQTSNDYAVRWID